MPQEGTVPVASSKHMAPRLSYCPIYKSDSKSTSIRMARWPLLPAAVVLRVLSMVLILMLVFIRMLVLGMLVLWMLMRLACGIARRRKHHQSQTGAAWAPLRISIEMRPNYQNGDRLFNGNGGSMHMPHTAASHGHI